MSGWFLFPFKLKLKQERWAMWSKSGSADQTEKAKGKKKVKKDFEETVSRAAPHAEETIH